MIVLSAFYQLLQVIIHYPIKKKINKSYEIGKAVEGDMIRKKDISRKDEV